MSKDNARLLDACIALLRLMVMMMYDSDYKSEDHLYSEVLHCSPPYDQAQDQIRRSYNQRHRRDRMLSTTRAEGC